MRVEEKSSIEEIRERFDKDVERFSCLETGQKTMVDAPLLLELLAESAVAVTCPIRRVLDIGCGAGNNTLKLLESSGEFACDLVDLSLPMLERAQARIAERTQQPVRIFQADIRTVVLPEERYDVILAAAVLHHLRDDADWHHVFAKLFSLTAPGGSVWISDMVCHEHPALQRRFWQQFASFLEAQGGKEYSDHVFSYIKREDSPRPVTYQLELLRNVGFAQVELLYKRGCFAAFGAIRAR